MKQPKILDSMKRKQEINSISLRNRFGKVTKQDVKFLLEEIELRVGPGTPHARMEMTWELMSPYYKILELLVPKYSIVSSKSPTTEMAFVEAFGIMASQLGYDYLKDGGLNGS